MLNSLLKKCYRKVIVRSKKFPIIFSDSFRFIYFSPFIFLRPTSSWIYSSQMFLLLKTNSRLPLSYFLPPSIFFSAKYLMWYKTSGIVSFSCFHLVYYVIWETVNNHYYQQQQQQQRYGHSYLFSQTKQKITRWYYTQKKNSKNCIYQTKEHQKRFIHLYVSRAHVLFLYCLVMLFCT